MMIKVNHRLCGLAVKDEEKVLREDFASGTEDGGQRRKPGLRCRRDNYVVDRDYVQTS
jgi:hypothetical protein